MKLPIVDGRECVPVRLIVSLTRRQTLTPDNVAKMFSWRHAFESARQWRKGTYQLHPDGSFSQLEPRDWDPIVDRLSILETEIRQRETFLDELHPEWDRLSLEVLPAGVFVWRDELEAAYTRMFGSQTFYVERPGLPDKTEEEYEAELDKIIQLDATADEAADSASRFDKLAEAAAAHMMTRPGDGELSFSPLLSIEERRVAFAGFEAALEAQEEVASANDRRHAGLATRERDTLLKLVIGMAIAGYRYSPDATRSNVPVEIASDLAKQGMSVTDDTIRKYLKEAATTVLPAKQPKT